MSITIMKQALKYLEKSHYLIADHERHAYVMEYNAFLEQFQQAIAQEALNRMAENARELGLDYETEQEPVAMRYDFDGYGWKYVDSGFGSNWQEWIRKLYKDAEPIYTSPPQPQEATPTEQEPVTVLPDGSAFGVMSWPLPKDHWLYAEREYRDGEYEPVELGKPILTHQLHDEIVSAVRYAIRGATNCGKDVDFDPDALVQNAVYALCGPYSSSVATRDTSQDYVNETPKQRHEQAQPVAYDKTEMNCFAQDLYDKKMQEGKRGHYESMFHVIHQCIKKATPPQQNQFNPDWDAMAVMVEEQQRMARRIEELEAQCKPMHEMLRVQGCDGTWNCDPYMHGMYNGMEYMLAMVENREPVFRDAPDKWLNTLPPASLASEAHDIKENT